MTDSGFYDCVLLVSNDIITDRRVRRIARTLQLKGLKVLIVGRNLNKSDGMDLGGVDYHHVKCHFNKGPLFYLEMVLRMIGYLNGHSFTRITANDLDTILVAYYFKKFRKITAYFDAHEYFTEVPELYGKTIKKFIWRQIGYLCMPSMDHCYTVNESLSNKMEERYQRKFFVVRNVPVALPQISIHPPFSKLRIVYLGVLNHGRGLFELLQAVSGLPDVDLSIIGDGDIEGPLKQMVIDLHLERNVQFIGRVSPDKLSDYLFKANLGINLLDMSSQSYRYSLANKYFDYIQHGLPVLTMDFAEYRRYNDKYECAVLVKNLDVLSIRDTLSRLASKPDYLKRLQNNCLDARKEYIWEKEEQKLWSIYALQSGSNRTEA